MNLTSRIERLERPDAEAVSRVAAVAGLPRAVVHAELAEMRQRTAALRQRYGDDVDAVVAGLAAETGLDADRLRAEAGRIVVKGGQR